MNAAEAAALPQMGDYDVIISAKNLAYFTNHSLPVSYYIAMEPDSTFQAN